MAYKVLDQHPGDTLVLAPGLARSSGDEIWAVVITPLLFITNMVQITLTGDEF